MREKPDIPEEELRACLQDQYNLHAVRFDVLSLGLDTTATIYHVVSQSGTAYVLKARSGSFYEASCLVPAYLREQGIAAVVAPLPTKKNTLWTQLGKWVVALYPFLAGDTSWTGMTDEHWKEVGAIFKRIHQVPSLGFASLRKETFDPTKYSRGIRAIEIQHAHEYSGDSASERALRSSWVAHQLMIFNMMNALEKLAEVLQRQKVSYVICHADLHPANLLRDHTDHVFVIDWDDVMLAPKERDFLFVKDASPDSSINPSISPFFQGYGQTTIDWTTLTYYRYERVIQDLIECAETVFFRNDLGEVTKADAARLFEGIFAEGDEVDAARAAAAHLPSHLSFHI